MTFPDDNTTSVVVDAVGSYSIDSPMGKVQPEGDVVVSASDRNGNGQLSLGSVKQLIDLAAQCHATRINTATTKPVGVVARLHHVEG